MKKTILITGATDGIGLETAKMLALQGHSLLLHGRNSDKLNSVWATLAELPGAGKIKGYIADLSRMTEVEALAKAVSDKHAKLDVLINNAGIFRTQETITESGLDIRFAVNTLAPYLLTHRLLPLLVPQSRVVNLSSAAQSAVEIEALEGKDRLADMPAYAQSKLALTMWTLQMARERRDQGPVMVAVNPGSMLGSKMVKEGFGVAGADLGIGAEVLCRAALSEEFAMASGRYFDNDSGEFSAPHADARNDAKTGEVVATIQRLLADYLS